MPFNALVIIIYFYNIHDLITTTNIQTRKYIYIKKLTCKKIISEYF